MYRQNLLHEFNFGHCNQPTDVFFCVLKDTLHNSLHNRFSHYTFKDTFSGWRSSHSVNDNRYRKILCKKKEYLKCNQRSSATTHCHRQSIQIWPNMQLGFTYKMVLRDSMRAPCDTRCACRCSAYICSVTIANSGELTISGLSTVWRPSVAFRSVRFCRCFVYGAWHTEFTCSYGDPQACDKLGWTESRGRH